jgi:hypothetical protein
VGKKKVSVSSALEEHLGDLPLSGVDAVRLELARKLAEAVEGAPSYALPRIAKELDHLLAALDMIGEAEGARLRAERLLRAVQ